MLAWRLPLRRSAKRLRRYEEVEGQNSVLRLTGVRHECDDLVASESERLLVLQIGTSPNGVRSHEGIPSGQSRNGLLKNALTKCGASSSLRLHCHLRRRAPTCGHGVPELPFRIERFALIEERGRPVQGVDQRPVDAGEASRKGTRGSAASSTLSVRACTCSEDLEVRKQALSLNDVSWRQARRGRQLLRAS